MGLNVIKSNDKWGKASSDINTNFTTIQTSVEKIKNFTYKNKGYFTTEESLKSSYPTPTDGMYAWVGTPYPGTVYESKNGVWINTEQVPETETIDLTEYATKTELEEVETQIGDISTVLDKLNAMEL